MPACTPQSHCRRGARAPFKAKPLSTILGSAFVLWACMAVFAAPVLALERVVPDDPSSVISTDGKEAPARAPVTDDNCLALLKTGGSVDFAVPAPPPPGSQSAVIGFVFGLRFALGSQAAHHTPDLAIWQPGTGGGQALAIADYRHCRNEAALREMNR